MRLTKGLIAVLAAVLYVQAATVYIYVGDSINVFADANPEGTTFILKSTYRSGKKGVHRMQFVIPRHNQKFLGEVDSKGNRLTVLNGAVVLSASSWKLSSDGYYVYENAPTQSGTNAIGQRVINGRGLDGGTTAPCTRPEDLFITDNGTCKVLKRVMSKSLVTPGKTWYFEEDKVPVRKIYIKDNPNVSGRVIELSQTKFAFGYDPQLYKGYYSPGYDHVAGAKWSPDAWPNLYSSSHKYYGKPRNITVQNLIVEKYANPAQTGAIGYFRPGLDWTIINNETRFNHGGGIKFRGKGQVRYNWVHHNGQIGILAGDGNKDQTIYGLEEWGFNGGYTGSGAFIEMNTIQDNNTIDFDPLWEAGGTKFAQCNSLMCRNNYVSGNLGVGLWSDFSFRNITFEANTVKNNGNAGIYYEISFEGAVRNNSCMDNGLLRPDIAYAAQINLSSSMAPDGKTIDIKDNTLFIRNGDPNARRHGVMVNQYEPDGTFRNIEGYPMYARNVLVRNNETGSLFSNGVNGLAGINYGHDKFRVTFSDNNYHYADGYSPSNSGYHWRWYDGNYLLGAAQIYFGQDLGSTVDVNSQPNVFAAGTDGRLYQYDWSAARFVGVQGLGVAVDGGKYGGGFHVNAAGDIWRLTPDKGWVRTTGCVGADVSASHDMKGGYAAGKDGYLYTFNPAQNAFNKSTIPGVRVVVDNNKALWYVTSAGLVYRSDPRSYWVNVKGCTAQDVGAGGGEVYAAGRDGYVYRYNHGTDRFVKTTVAAVRVAVSGEGTAWAVKADGTILRTVPGMGWLTASGCIAQDIGG